MNDRLEASPNELGVVSQHKELVHCQIVPKMASRVEARSLQARYVFIVVLASSDLASLGDVGCEIVSVPPCLQVNIF